MSVDMEQQTTKELTERIIELENRVTILQNWIRRHENRLIAVEEKAGLPDRRTIPVRGFEFKPRNGAK